MAVTLNDTQTEDAIDAAETAVEYWSPDADCSRCRGPVLCDDCKTAGQKRIRYASLARQLRKAAGHG